MHKIIFDTFEFDLTPYDISIVEENYWFSDRFFTKYSFPFNFKLTESLLVIFGDLLDDNSKFIETSYNVTYVLGNQLETALFEIESQIGEEIEATFRFGFDELPNYSKKLAELPLEVIPEANIVNIYNHAKTIVSKKWPEVNYNYPQIYTDKYDNEDLTWSVFQNKINNYVNSNFLVNDTVDGLFINRNILQPLPYLLHVLEKGFLDAGFTLKGDILNNETIKKILIFSNLDYFTIQGADFNFNLNNSLYNIDLGNNMVKVESFIDLVPDKEYRITGKIFLHNNFAKGFENSFDTYTKIIYNNIVLAELVTKKKSYMMAQIDVTFTTTTSTNPALQKLSFSSVANENYLSQTFSLFELNITREVKEESSQIKIHEDVDLTRAVADVTFGYLLNEVRKQFNLEIKPIGSDIFLNFIEDQVNYKNATDLSDKEILKPKKEFNKLDSLLLKYKDSSNTNYLFDSIYQNKNLTTIDVNLVSDKTETIELDILPLPQKSKNGIVSAFAFEPEEEKSLYFCLYDGLQNNLNTCIDPSPLFIPNLHELHHLKWFTFRLNGIRYRWLFKMYEEELRAIDKKVFAYGRYHIVKNLEKNQISKDLFEIEIETETLP